MKETEIAWCDSTFNPWWGCVKVSEGCRHCYAETFAKRVGQRVWGPTAEHRRFGDKHWNEPLRWNAEAAKSGKPWRVFCASMADVFEGRDEDTHDRARLWKLIEATPHLTWLLLTKRPENMIGLAPWGPDPWPRNAWAGCTVENQDAAERRISHLLRVPAAVRFLSCEPLLGAVDLSTWIAPHECCSSCLEVTDGLRLDNEGHAREDCANCGPAGDLITTWGDAQTERWVSGARYEDGGPHESDDGPQLHWVIVGGESGPGARPFDLAWARSIREQCAAAGVPYFFKQAGAYPVLNDDRLALKDRKGGDLDELRQHAPSVCAREWPAPL